MGLLDQHSKYIRTKRNIQERRNIKTMIKTVSVMSECEMLKLTCVIKDNCAFMEDGLILTFDPFRKTSERVEVWDNHDYLVTLSEALFSGEMEEGTVKDLRIELVRLVGVDEYQKYMLILCGMFGEMLALYRAGIRPAEDRVDVGV